MAKRKAEEAFSASDNQTRKHSKPHHKSKQQNSSQNAALRDRAAKLLTSRQQLPIWPHADEIRQKVRDNDVLVLVGETGSGKSTQIPQFLFEEDWCRPVSVKPTARSTDSQTKAQKSTTSSEVKVGGRVGILQPRRVAAVSLASRVAQEVGCSLGPDGQVGYSVRFDNNTSTNTRIKFLTDGMLLQELLRDPWLREYSCVIVDEVHERGVNVDLALGLIKRILKAHGAKDGRAGVPLKVVVMSATADMDSITKFFEQSTSKSGEPGTNGAQNSKTASTDAEVPNAGIAVASCHIKGRQYPVTITYAPQPVVNLLDAAMERIIDIHTHTPLPGDILVFLSGQEMIESLESLCTTYASTLRDTTKPMTKKTPDLPALQVLPLFASLPTHLQSRIFAPTPRFTRRVILATNIAETSITVPNVRHVIDTGKHKARAFRPGLNLDTLLSNPITQSMATQRAGRAGREAAGTCTRLYTQQDFRGLAPATAPEILRTDLRFAVLSLKAHGVQDILAFEMLTVPERRGLEAALEGLVNLGALDEEGITEIGRKMAGIPVRPDLARCLLEGTRYGDEVREGVVDIVSALSLEEGVFLPIHGKSQRKENGQVLLGRIEDSDDESSPVEAARRTLLSRSSDHVTLWNSVKGYSDCDSSERRAWCDAHGVSHRAMARVMDVRRQLSQMMQQKKFRLAPIEGVAENGELTGESVLATTLRREAVLKCLVTGLWTNVAVVNEQKGVNPNQRAPYVTLLTNQPIHLHPSSVLFMQMGSGGGKKDEKKKTMLPPAVVFTDLIYTSKPYARNVSAIELSWVTDMGMI